MQNKKILCADAATENCPCMLAETGDCLICSRLKGMNECDCDWTGVCVYNEFIQNGRKRALTRAEKTLMIKDMKTTADGGFVIMELECGRGFALSCLAPGTHLFVRPADREKYFDTPLSILRSELKTGAADSRATGVITICFRALSAKTKALAECRAGGAVIARGPYRNGIKGLPRGLSGKKALIAAAGAGVVPGLFAAGLLAAHNDVELDVVDAGSAEREIIDNYTALYGSDIKNHAKGFTVKFFGNYNKESVKCIDATSHDQNRDSTSLSESTSGNARVDPDAMLPSKVLPIEGLYEASHNGSADALILLGSSGFINSVLPYARENKDAFIAVSNNAVMSCGEGVCGACGGTGADGRRIIGCKCTDCGV